MGLTWFTRMLQWGIVGLIAGIVIGIILVFYPKWHIFGVENAIKAIVVNAFTIGAICAIIAAICATIVHHLEFGRQKTAEI